MKTEGTEYSPFKAVHHIQALRDKKPLLCYWLITSRCTYDCPVCSNKYYSEFVHDSELSFPILKDVADQMKELGVKAISLSGGEPTLYHEFNRLLDYCLSIGFDIAIISNGSCIDNVDISLLKKCKWIRFSINSMSKESFRTVHGVEPLDIHNILAPYIKGIRSEGCIVGTSFLIQPANMSEMVDFVKWSKEVGFNTARFSYVRNKAGDIIYSDVEQEIIQKQIAQSVKLTDDDFTVFGLSNRISLSRAKNFKHCYMEDVAFCIAANGAVYRCCSLQYHPMGNIGSIQDNTLASILAKKDVVDPQKCPACWHDKKNEFMEYLMDDNPRHVNFI